MLKNQCIAVLTKSGQVGWAWKDSFTVWKREMRSDVAATALFLVKEGQSDAEVQKLAEQALASQVERWAANQSPEED